MIAAQKQVALDHLTRSQQQALRKFKKRLAEKLPNFDIAWVHSFKDNIIELHLESDKRTYRNSLQAAEVAIEVEDETGILIILR